MEKTGWKDPLKELPEPYQDVLILVGDRSVRCGHWNPLVPIGGWILTDCTHPLQNAYHEYSGTKWRND